MLDETVNRPGYPLGPHNVDATKIPMDSFEKIEVESWAQLVALYAQANRNKEHNWPPFNAQDLTNFQASRGRAFKRPETFHRCLDEMVEKGLLSSEERDGITIYLPTHKLVARYFASEPLLPPSLVADLSANMS